MPTALKDIISGIRSLEPFPHVATTVLTLSGQKDIVPNELIEVIQMDPGLTAKVLKLCNSAYYGFQREIASLPEAGNLLGISTLVNLVLTSSANGYFQNHSETTNRPQKTLWTRCVTNALASRILAREHGLVDEERAYTAGLLQNIGNLVLDRFVEDGIDQLLAEVGGGRSLLEAERRVLGVHHAEIGARLSTRWDLPDVLVDTIRFHHNPEESTVDPVLASTIHLAETMTCAMASGDNTYQLGFDVSEAALDLTGLEDADFEAIDMEIESELQRAQDFLEV